MTNEKPLNKKAREIAIQAIDEILEKVSMKSFHGEASLELTIIDGFIREVSRTIDQGLALKTGSAMVDSHEDAKTSLNSILSEVLVEGFYGIAVLKMTITDGVIKLTRILINKKTRIERDEKHQDEKGHGYRQLTSPQQHCTRQPDRRYNIRKSAPEKRF